MPDARHISAIWRLLVLFEAQRAGLEATRVLELDPGQRASPNRDWHRLNGCRQTAIYLAHTVFGLSYSEIATVAKVHPPGITRIVHEIEDAREDDPQVEQWLAQVEAALHG